MKRQRILLYIVLVSVLVTVLCACSIPMPSVYIYSDIAECKKIVEDIPQDSYIKIYENANNDKFLQDQTDYSFFGCEYTSDDYSFELLAYTFSNNKDAVDYYTNFSRIRFVNSPAWHDSGGSFNNFKRIVLNGNNVYVLYTKTSTANDVCAFVNSYFSVFISDW